MGICTCTINTDHIFYNNFLRHFENDVDSKTAFELFLASLIRTIDEAKESQRKDFDELISLWNEKLRKYINEQFSSNNTK
jgi:hypothetical protein